MLLTVQKRMWRAQRTERTPLEVRRQAREAAAEAEIAVPSALARSRTGTVIVVDVAHMRAINRRYGVDAGDRLIRAIEASLRTRLRNAVVTRLPGDQFILIVPVATAREQIEGDVRLAVSHARAIGFWLRRIRTSAHTGSASWHDEHSRRSAISEAEMRLGKAASGATSTSEGEPP